MHVIFSVIDEHEADDVGHDVDVIPRVDESVSFDTAIPGYRHERFIVQKVTHFPLGGPQNADSYLFVELSKVE